MNADRDVSSAVSRAAQTISQADYLVAFTGAGISVESGVPPFRGPGGLWDRYDPQVLDIRHFLQHPAESWRVIREIFYETFTAAEPNTAHKVLAYWEKIGLLKALITQNIDDLHRRAGSGAPIEYHGNSRMLVSTETGERVPASADRLLDLPPVTDSGALLKPDFVFFGEGIPADAARRASHAARTADVLVVIGTTGEVYPAAELPQIAAANGATIVEINPEETVYTASVTDIFIRESAVRALAALSTAI